MTRPNILFCLADDAGMHFGAYGCPWVTTPNFDRVADKGLLFTNAFTPNAKPIADPIEPIPPVKTYTPYEYGGLSGRDPFRQSITEGSDDVRATTGTGPRPDFERSKQYLERYELDTLSMVGTFGKEQSYWALLRDPEGIIHRVPVGDYIGKNHGRVVDINDTQIGLSELISDGAGGWLVREASIALGEG